MTVETISAISSLLGTLLWPALILTIVLLFKVQLKRLLGGVEEVSVTTPGGIEASAKFRMQAAIAAAAAVKGTDAGEDASQTLTEAEEIADQVTSIRRGRSRGTIRVLWVDDNPRNNDYERVAVESLGAVVTTATDTESAITEVTRSNFDVIITDMSRPPDHQAGYTLLAKLGGQGVQAPVIIYSGTETADTVAEAKRRGAFGQTNRPGQLIRLVTNALQVGTH